MATNHTIYKTRTILVVDTVAVNRDYLQDIFGDTYRVLGADSSAEAIEILGSEQVALILLDIQDSITSGCEFIQTVKNEVGLADIPIIVTFAIDDGLAEIALDLGADDCLVQPYNPVVAKKRVSNLIARQELNEISYSYKDTFNHTNEMIVIADWESREMLYLNKIAAQKNGDTVAQLIGRKCSQIAQNSDDQCYYCFKKDLNYDKLTIRELSVGPKHYLCKGKRIIWHGREAFVEYVSDITAQHNMTEQVVFERNMLSAASRVMFPMCIISNLTQNTYKIVEYERFNMKQAKKTGVYDELLQSESTSILEADRENYLRTYDREKLLKDYHWGKKIITLVSRQLGDDGIVHWQRVTMVFAEYLFNGDVYSIAFVDDVDEEKEKEMHLQAALKNAEYAHMAKTAFLSRVSHDMRTPLNGILGLTTILRDSVTDDKVSNVLSKMELTGKYLMNLINDTLDVSCMENSQLPLHPTVCDSRNLFNNIISLGKEKAKTKNIKLNIKTVNLVFGLFYLDSGRIQQIVMNVLGNAIKFSHANSKIDITMTNIAVENNLATDRIVIRDYGIGMSKEYLPYVFEAYSQEDGSRTSVNQGAGLGMAIAKHLTKLMGGDITVESELGQGSTVTIEWQLPMATPEQIEAWKKNRIVIDETVGLKNKRALICEDNSLNAMITSKLLETKGMIVEVAENGQIGVDKFVASEYGYYDVILMDIRMPVMDGIDATKAIRALPRRDARYIPIIAVTANALPMDIQQTQEAGMNAHLSKPVQTDLVYSTLVKVLKVENDIRKKVILVVDDFKINREVIRLALEHEYEILEATGGHEALKILSTNKGIDVVITDIQMPEMDGGELIHQIRSQEKFRHLVIIANTEYGNIEQEEKLLLTGANDFVYKPTTPKILELRVRNALKRI